MIIVPVKVEGEILDLSNHLDGNLLQVHPQSMSAYFPDP